MLPVLLESITVDQINLPILKERNINIDVLRLDKIHPVISGNKWFKLKYYLQSARDQGKEQIVTFGGAYSNHLVATAALGSLLGYKTEGIIRGEKPKKLSHTLIQSADYGMQLFFVSRGDYRKKLLPFELAANGNIYLVPEGGFGKEGVNGAAEILGFCKKGKYSHIACAVGTSTMMAGVVKASVQGQKTIGISVLKNNIALGKELSNSLPEEDQRKKFEILHDYHFGGYAKYSNKLISFMNEFYMGTSIPSDFVYTGKLFFAIIEMVRNNSFPVGSDILMIHSGGLQGNYSLPKGTLLF